MKAEEIKERVRAYILKESLPGENPSELTDSLPLITGRILDSLATLKLVAFLEESFEVEFAAHEVGAANLDTVDQITSFVLSKRQAR
jgi:acyl carrier protein